MPPPLPHHVAYRSVLRGSVVYTYFQIVGSHGWVSKSVHYYCLGEHRVQHACRSPCSLSAVRQFMLLPFWKMKCPKYFISRPHLLLLFPVHCPDSVAEPFIRFHQQVLHVCIPVIVHPPSCISPELFFSFRVAPLVSPGCHFP